MPGLFEQVGTALFGARWQQETAAALGVTDRTIRRWHADNAVIPPGVWDDLKKLAVARRQACGDAVVLIRGHQGKSPAT